MNLRHFLYVLLILLVKQTFVKSDDNLYSNPVIYSVDRLNNQTVRLFRESDFWDLSRFPDNTKLGPKQTLKEYPFFSPVTTDQRVVTVLEGSPEVTNRTFKFGGQYWWSWYTDPKYGVRYVATSKGQYWDEIPKDGFKAVFHNGDQSDPMLIALEADPKYSNQHMKIHYFSTKSMTYIRKTSDAFDENDFPIDMTDAFGWTSKDSSSVYIIKNDKYCRLTNRQKCTGWKSNQELFGCPGKSGGGSDGDGSGGGGNVGGSDGSDGGDGLPINENPVPSAEPSVPIPGVGNTIPSSDPGVKPPPSPGPGASKQKKGNGVTSQFTSNVTFISLVTLICLAFV